MTRCFERRMAAKFAFVAGLFVLASPAASQQPSSAQRDAIRQACRSDYEAHCASVSPGGKQALTCLQKNMASLSPSCQTAVAAIGQPSATPAAAPASPATKSAPAPSTATTAPPAQATVGAAPVAPMRALTLRQEILLVRTSCGEDFRAYCSNVQIGGGRAVACLRANAASLSPTCQSAMLGLAQSR